MAEREIANDVERRARLHAVLGDPHRLRIVDALSTSDLTPGELAAHADLSTNLLAFHLDVLEEAGLIGRHVSQGDRRRRYVTLLPERLDDLRVPTGPTTGPVLFVCTHNSARSPFAAALWQRRTGGAAFSAGTDPAERIHPLAVAVGAERGVDLTGDRPHAYTDVEDDPGLVVSVCDRTRESGIPFDAPSVHWSIPDPVDADREGFVHAFALIEERVARLAARVSA